MIDPDWIDKDGVLRIPRDAQVTFTITARDLKSLAIRIAVQRALELEQQGKTWEVAKRAAIDEVHDALGKRGVEITPGALDRYKFPSRIPKQGRGT